jgi:cytochrome c peroxidase
VKFSATNNRTTIGAIVAALFGVSMAFYAPFGEAAPTDSYLRPDVPPAPVDNRLTPARAELGKILFFDPRLSGSNWISCASCHNPALGWSDGLPTAIGVNMAVLRRATPTILNTAYNRIQMWDGRKPTLEEQATGPIEAPDEMNQDLDELVKELSAIPGYKALFEKSYPGESISKQTIGKAIASFERTVLSTDAAFDRWLKGDVNALNAAAKRGFALFEGKANCVACHEGFNFVDDGFHNIGLKKINGVEDEGRFAHKKVKILKGAFKTPTLRDIALTAPYMHNGVYKTLEDVIDHYNRGGENLVNPDPNMRPLNLTPRDKADLVAFLKSLTGKHVPVTIPQLPN